MAEQMNEFGGMLTVLDAAPSNEERQQSLDNCIDLLNKAFRSVWKTKAHFLTRIDHSFAKPLTEARHGRDQFCLPDRGAPGIKQRSNKES
jgi:hypothetical protein